MKKIACVLLWVVLSLTVVKVCGTNGYEIVAVSGSTPTIDGTVGSGEWSDAANVQFNLTTVLVKQDGVNLYVGFKMGYPMSPEPNATILFDVDHDGNKLLQSDDLKVWIFRNGTRGEASVRDWQWTPDTIRGWQAEIRIYEFAWDAEFNITYSKIDVTAGAEKTIGVAFLATGYQYGEYTVDSWPPDHSQILNNPSMWGNLTSTGYDWIPEYSSFVFLPMVTVTTLLAILVHRRKESLSPSDAIHAF